MNISFNAPPVTSTYSNNLAIPDKKDVIDLLSKIEENTTYENNVSEQIDIQRDVSSKETVANNHIGPQTIVSSVRKEEVNSGTNCSNNKLQIQHTNSIELKLLRNCIEKSITQPELELCFTLRQYLAHKLQSGLMNCQEPVQRNRKSAFISIVNLLHAKEYDPKEVEDDFNILVSKFTGFNKTLLPLIAKIGFKWFDKSLYEILCKPLPIHVTTEMQLLISITAYQRMLPFITSYLRGGIIESHNLLTRISCLHEIINDGYSKFLSPELVKNKSNTKAIIFHHKKLLDNIQNNIAVINNFMYIDVEQFTDSFSILNDYLFAKFKNRNKVYVQSLQKIEAIYAQTFRATLNVWENFDIRAKELKKHPLFNAELILGNYDFLKLHKMINSLEKQYDKTHYDTSITLKPRRLLEIINAITLDLFNQYTSISGVKSDAEIHQSMSWIMFGDEIDEANEASKKVDSIQKTHSLPFANQHEQIQKSSKSKKIEQKAVHANVGPLTASNNNRGLDNSEKNFEVKNLSNTKSSMPIKNINVITPPHKHEQLLVQHSQLIHELSKGIKGCLQLQCKEAKLQAGNFERAKLNSKELRDHLNYASLNFNLFCKAIISKDLYAIGAIIPFLCLDLHLTMEQLIKHMIAVKNMPSSRSHNLSELSTYASFDVHPDLQPFIEDFSNAMLQVRYPIAWEDMDKKMAASGPLKWMQYSQKICQIINSDVDYKNGEIDPGDLKTMCNFVIESYQKTLQCLLQQPPFDLKVQLLVTQISEGLDSLKVILELAISNEKESLTSAAIKIKKTRTAPIIKKPILELRQSLLDIGNSTLQNVKINQIVARQVLTEASIHIIRIDAVDYLQKNYEGLQFAALHHRNLMMFQWVYEQIYRFNGFVTEIGDLRWIPSHNLSVYHALTFPGESMPTTLSEFNLGRNLHYSHEMGPGKSLPMVQELLCTRKALKRLDPSNPDWTLAKSNKSPSSSPGKVAQSMKNYRVKILNDGKKLLDTLVEMSKPEAK